MPTRISGAMAGSTTGNNATTSAINTLTARLLVVQVIDVDGSSTISDSAGNSWSHLTTYSGAGTAARIHYVINPATSATHTFTVTSTGKLPLMFVEAFSCSSTPAFDGQNGGFAVVGTLNPRHTGTVTPGTTNAVVVSCYGLDLTGPPYPTEQTGWTTTNNLNSVASQHYGGGSAYKVVSSTSAIEAQWQGNAALFPNAPYAIASFSEAPVSGGGGVIANTADPTDGPTFTGREIGLRAWLEINFDDATRYYSTDTFSDTTSNKFGCLISLGSITYSLTDRFGAYRMATVSIEAHDAKRLFATLEATAGSAKWLNREVRIKLSTPAAIASGATPWTLFRGIWRDYSSDGLRLTFAFEDRIGSTMTEINFDRPVPHRLIRDDFSNRYTDDTSSGGNPIPLSSETLSKVVPIAYGTISDAYIVSSEGRYIDQRRGKISPIYVGKVTCLDTVVRHEWVICGHAIAGIDESYVDSALQNPNSDYIGPQSTAWTSAISATKYVTYGSRRYTTVYRPVGDATADAIISGEKSWTFNLRGVEDVGDGTGGFIDLAPRIIYHLINNWMILQYNTGSWPAVPTSADSIPWLNHQSFRALETWEIAQTGDGFKPGIYIDAALTTRQLMERLAIEMWIRFGQNIHGQLTAYHPPSATVDSVNDVSEIVSTKISRSPDELENQLLADWDYRQADGSYGHPGDTYDATAPPAGFATDVNALTYANGRYVARDQTTQFRWAMRGIDVVSVIAYRLVYGKRIPRVISVTGPIHWIRIKVGTAITITDSEGVGATGWVDQKVWVEGMDINLGGLTNAPSVTLHCRDMEGLI